MKDKFKAYLDRHENFKDKKKKKLFYIFTLLQTQLRSSHLFYIL